MPFKSVMQYLKFKRLIEEGKMSQKTLNEWLKETKGKRLPYKAKKKK